jgi:hypothetical protein
MAMTTRRMAALLAVTAGLSLTGCGTTAQVVRRPPVTTTPTSLDATTLNQIDQQINGASTALNQANSDLNNPKPDS